MSQRSAGRRSRRAAARPESRVKRTFVALGTVVLVITPISWILLHQPQSDTAEAAVPYVTRDDDTYIKTSTTPEESTPPVDQPTEPAETPSATGTPKPTTTPTKPGETPSTTAPTDGPTTGPTDGPSDGPTDGPTATTKPTQPPNSQQPRPTHSPSTTPSSTPTSSSPPPPSDNGSMSAEEVELFSLVDNERAERGCAPLNRNSNLTGGARQDAETRAKRNELNAGGSSMAATGGEKMSAKAAFDRMKSNNAGTLFNCGLKELGVGFGDAEYCKTQLILCVATSERYAWVADFK